MIRLTFCLRRRPDVSEEEFHRYWLDAHGPLTLLQAEALGMRRYVQGHTLHGELNDMLTTQRGTLEPFDGIADVWFDGIDEMLAAASSPDGRLSLKTLLRDEATFIDLARSSVFLMEEHVLLGD